MNAELAGQEQDHHAPLAELLDEIEAAVVGQCCAGAATNLQRLRAELTRHIDGESWLGGTLGDRSSCLRRLYESGAMIRRRLFEVRDALGAQDAVAVAAGIADLREMIATHLALEREAAGALGDLPGVTADTPA